MDMCKIKINYYNLTKARPEKCNFCLKKGPEPEQQDEGGCEEVQVRPTIEKEETRAQRQTV